MPRICYQDQTFSDWKMSLINTANEIVEEYTEKGYRLTLRQLYYQFVARDLLPERWADPATGSTNNQRAYNNLGTLIGDARMAGEIDWTSIEDRTRERDGNTHWRSPEAIIKAVSEQYKIDKWEGQLNRPEVWVEKDALEGVIDPVCRRLDIPFFSCRGYTSMTSMWENAQYLKGLAKKGAVPVILHLGDHDPSGIDMSRDIEERVRQFMDGMGGKLVFKRIALNRDQIDTYHPPENPAKSTDSRFKDYQKIHGDSSWELDALDPEVIDALITSEVNKLKNATKYKHMEAKEETERGLLEQASGRWAEVKDLLEAD